MKIALIGGARKMGEWLARFLGEEGFELIVADKDSSWLTVLQQRLGVRASSNIDAMKEAEVVIISVDLNSFEETLKELSPFCPCRSINIRYNVC